MYKKIKNILKLLILSVIILFGLKTYSQKAILDTNRILIGDQVKLKIQIDIEKEKTINFTFFEKELISGIEILDYPEIDTVNNGKTLQQSFLITSFEDSTFHIPPISILVDDDTLKTNPLILEVRYFKPDSIFISKIDTTEIFKIRDIKKNVKAPWTFAEFWNIYGKIILMVFFSILLIGAILYYIIRRRKNKPIFIPSKPKELPHVTALKKLDILKEKKLWQKGKVKAYYTKLTEILRIYIVMRFNIPALEYTSFQLIIALEHNNLIENGAIEKLKQILTFADLAKFAKMQPLADENDNNLKNAYFFIDNTKPVHKEEDAKEPEINN